MLTRNSLNLLLLAILAVLVTLTLFEPGKEKEISQPGISQKKHDEISHIKITRPGEPAITLSRQSGVWRLTEPKETFANTRMVESILSLLDETSHAHYPASSMETAVTGLDRPQLCVWLNQEPLCFGKREPLHQQRYLQSGETVHLITDTHSHLLPSDFSRYVSPKLFPGDQPITAITLPDLQLQQQSTEWQLQPEDAKISQDQRQHFIDNWQHAEALTVTPYLDDASEESITVTLGDQQIRFEMISSEPELVLARPELGIQYHLAEGSLGQLTRLESE